MSKRLNFVLSWDMVNGFFDRYKRRFVLYDSSGYRWINEISDRKLKYLLFVFMDANKNVIRIKDASLENIGKMYTNEYRQLEITPIETGKIYLDEYNQLKNGYINVYLNQVNDNNLLLSKRVGTLEEPTKRKYISVKNITKVSSDPSDCKYEWQYDGDCSTTCGTGQQREILRITERQFNGGVQCNVSDYGAVRYSECTERSGCLIQN
jgi:hypothetical protein